MFTQFQLELRPVWQFHVASRTLYWYQGEPTSTSTSGNGLAGQELRMERPYDESGLQSLFGYGRAAHERSGGICQLCGCGAGPEIDFDL